MRGMAVVLLASLVAGCSGGQLEHCGGAPRLVPTYTANNPTGPEHQEYTQNGTQFDAVCLPEAWHFMQDKWQAVREDRPSWPIVVVIDDGFYPSDDSTIRPEIHPGYPDGSRVHPQGTAWGDIPPRGGSYGHHGTEVLSLLASKTNNGFLISGVAGPWSNIPNGDRWGAYFLPVRFGAGLNGLPTTGLLSQIFSDVVLSLNQIFASLASAKT